MAELFEKTAYRNYKRPTPNPDITLANNDKLHVYENIQNPFNQLHTMLWR
jgi:hypothetical protein